ncbi:sulfurtransferase TusA family protein [Pedococcus sp. NPDC057267]|uniref:sulfurtransferase TusA family protein n=1 Tax=Pedococcus sp. NPDC057267 TaxID=3346077 RepID=UPI003633B7DD
MSEDDVVDARGLRCPLPVIRLAQRARDAAPGTELEVWSTDPAAAADVPAWCRMRGHTFVGARDCGEHTAYRVRLGSPGTAVS